MIDSTRPPGVVVLISGRGSNLQSLIDAQAAGELGAEIRAVVSNRADAFGLERARAAGIETVVVNHRDDAGRLAARVLAQEHRIYPLAVRWFAAGRMRLEGGRVVLDGEPLAEPARLTPEMAAPEW